MITAAVIVALVCVVLLTLGALVVLNAVAEHRKAQAYSVLKHAGLLETEE